MYLGPLFGDDASDGRMAAYIAGAGVLGAGATWLFNFLRDVWRERRGLTEKKESTLIEHLDRTAKRWEGAYGELERRYANLLERVNRIQERASSLVGHVRYTEALLRNARIEFDAWTEPEHATAGHGSDVHKPLTPPLEFDV